MRVFFSTCVPVLEASWSSAAAPVALHTLASVTCFMRPIGKTMKLRLRMPQLGVAFRCNPASFALGCMRSPQLDDLEWLHFCEKIACLPGATDASCLKLAVSMERVAFEMLCSRGFSAGESKAESVARDSAFGCP